MRALDKGVDQITRIKRYTLVLMVAWSLAIAFSLTFNLKQHQHHFLSGLLAQARALHSTDLEYRNWIISHGGVYVPVDETTPPSPYLAHVPERDVITPAGQTLTLLNSSYAMRQVHELMAQHNTLPYGRISSLNPINPINKADAWEAKALKAFQTGSAEASEAGVLLNGKPYFRYMEPMITQKSCLKCHAAYGDKEGDIRGGISVAIPMTGPLSRFEQDVATLKLAHGAIWLLGLIGLFIGGKSQQRAQLKVDKSEAEVRLLTNSIAHAIFGIDQHGNCTFANEACVEILGYESEQELLGRDMHQLVHHSDSDGTPVARDECPILNTVKDTQQSHIDHHVFWRRDGSSFPCSYWSYPVMRNDHCVGAVVTFMDISEQIRIGKKLKQSQQLINSIVEHVPAMIFLKDAKELRFELINKAGEQLLGVPRDKLLGCNDYDFFPKEQADFFTQKDRQVLANREVLDIPEEPIQTATGEEKWLHTYKIGLYDDHGESTHLLGISLDITSSVAASNALRESQKELAEAQRIAHVGSWQLDLESEKLEWSDEIFHIFEIDPQPFEASYEGFLNAIHPDDREMVDQAYRQSLADQTPYEVEHRLLMDDGRIKYVVERCESIFDETGRPLRSNGTVEDITARKQTEIALRKNKERYDDLVQRIPVGIYLYRFHTDGSDQFEYVSPRFCKLLNLSDEALMDDPRLAFDLAHPDDMDSLLKANGQAFETHQPLRWEGRFIINGETRWIKIESDPKLLPDGSSLWNGVLSDITERKQAQLALVENEEKFRAITTTAYDAIIVMNDEGKVAFWNRAAEQLFGYTFEEVKDAPVHELLAPESFHHAYRKGFDLFRREGKGPAIGKQIELIGRKKNGEEFPLELSVASTRLQGKWNAIGVIRDITERKRAETAINHANRALQTLSTVNRELVHATGEASLLQAICQAIVDQKDYPMAWVGYLRTKAPDRLLVMGSAGDSSQVLTKLETDLADTDIELHQHVLQTGKPFICEDIANETLYGSWGEILVRQGFASSITLPLKDDTKVFGLLAVYANEENAFAGREVDLLEEMAGDLAFGVTSLRVRQQRDHAMQLNEAHLEQMHETLHQTVTAISKAVEARDPYTAGHQRRVADLACAIGEKMGLDENRIEGIRMGATIHDIGKIQVPAELLTKPTRLTEIEYQLIQAHCEVGYEILDDINFPWPVAEIAYQHHERIDGSGYPQGLKGEEINLEARIVAVADVVEAMSSHRPYRPGLGIEAALAEISKQRGAAYDSDVVDACIAIFEAGYTLK